MIQPASGEILFMVIKKLGLSGVGEFSQLLNGEITSGSSNSTSGAWRILIGRVTIVLAQPVASVTVSVLLKLTEPQPSEVKV